MRNLFNIGLLFALAFILLSSSSCKKDPEPKYEPTPKEFIIPQGFPTNVNIPEDNPQTVEGIELGRYLFYDDRINGRADEGKGMSCSSCHLQENSFENGSGKGIGVDGLETHHTMLPLINLAWNPGTFGWNGSVSSIEEDVWIVITDPTEFASTHKASVEAISNIEMYPPLFEKAFGDDEVSMDRIAKALSQFIRTFVSSDSKFDKVLRGEAQFSIEEQRGLVLFTTEAGADCFHCHGAPGNPLMTTHLFYNNAKDSVFDLAHDRYSVTGNPSDKGAYKATTLRNIELTGPYMHDGRFETLEEVINFYSEGLIYSDYAHPLMHKLIPPYGQGAELNPQQKADLLAFLKSLTDTTFINNPKYKSPF
jgi:cytochrome c peroxidase